MVRLVPLALALAATVGVRALNAQSAPQPPSASRVAVGVVKALSDTSLTLDVRGTEMLFAIAPTTRFIASGLASDLLLRESKAVHARWVRTLAKNGNRASVTFRRSDRGLNAVEVRIIQR